MQPIMYITLPSSSHSECWARGRVLLEYSTLNIPDEPFAVRHHGGLGNGFLPLSRVQQCHDKSLGLPVFWLLYMQIPIQILVPKTFVMALYPLYDPSSLVDRL